MYSKTSELGNYLKRVASHSTKPHPSGRIDITPVSSQEQQLFDLELEHNIVKRDRQSKIQADIRKGRYLLQKRKHLYEVWLANPTKENAFAFLKIAIKKHKKSTNKVKRWLQEHKDD